MTPEHAQRIRDDLSAAEREVLLQLFTHGPVWDGNIVSKTGRSDLVSKGYADRYEGFSFLTALGVQICRGSFFWLKKER